MKQNRKETFRSLFEREMEDAIFENSLDIELLIYSTALFGKSAQFFEPSVEALKIYDTAIELLNKAECGVTLPRIEEIDDNLSFFYSTYVVNYNNMREDHKALFKSWLITGKSHIEDQLRLKEERKKETEQRAKEEYAQEEELIKNKYNQLVEIVAFGLSSENSETDETIINKADEYWDLHPRHHSKGDLIYSATKNKQIMEFYFLKTLHQYSRKADFIVQCLKHNDIELATKLIDLLKKTSEFDNFADMNDSSGNYRGYSWETELGLTFEYVLKQFADTKKDMPLNESRLLEIKRYLHDTVQSFLPILTNREKRRMILSLLPVYSTSKEQEYYLELLSKVLHQYENKNKYIPFTSTKYYYCCQDVIGNSFQILEYMGRPDLLQGVISVLLKEGVGKSPYQVCRWVAGCMDVISPKTCNYLFSNNEQLFIDWIKLGPNQSDLDDCLNKLEEVDKVNAEHFSQLITEISSTKIFDREQLWKNEQDQVQLSDIISDSIPSDNGLYVSEILLLAYCKTGKYPYHEQEYPNFWNKNYGVKNVNSTLTSLRKRGFIKFKSRLDSLDALKIEDLRSILKRNKLQSSGNKNVMIERIRDNLTEAQLKDANVQRQYELTDKGNIELNENEYIYLIHKNRFFINYEEVTPWQANILLAGQDKDNYRERIENRIKEIQDEYLF